MAILIPGKLVDIGVDSLAICPFCGVFLSLQPETAGSVARWRGECPCGYRYLLVPESCRVLQVRPGIPREWEKE
jgi:hypothetical protein